MQQIELLLQNLLSAQHVSGTIMPIIRSSRIIQLRTRPTTGKPKSHVAQAATICIILELMMMGIMVTETCSADNKFCNKNPIYSI
jgi:hypothetical protein